jgi:diaminohydroxyphosphoribosylaminopyrimidine deaminase/5-amino-6-(5-phosphoribosylamino)uracil reductase
LSTNRATLRSKLMMEALKEAGKGRGKTYPNPGVGAVVARGDRIVGRGFHRKWGLPHAEVEAIADAGRACRGADLYVTLEPCCHYGKTPPCTDAIIRSGITRVFVAVRDPNPAVNGRGIRGLRSAGVEVRTGLCAAEARKLNEAYFKFMTRHLPFVTLKIAQTLDGRIATLDRSSRWITSPLARGSARRMRAEAQAILVGVGTVINDDPMLLPVPRRKNDYVRCVLDSTLSIPPGSRLVRTAGEFPTAVYCTSAPDGRRQRLEAAGVDMRAVKAGGAGKGTGPGHPLVDLGAVLRDLAARGVMHLFVEGGAATASGFLEAGLVDKLLAFIAPKVLGDTNGLGSFAKIDVKTLRRCYRFRTDAVRQVGEDILMTLYPKQQKRR